MILGALCMIVANAATLLGAHALLDRIRSGNTSADVVVFLLLRFLLISATILAAGLCGFLNPLALGAAGLIVLAGLLAAGAYRRLPRPAFPEGGRLWLLFGGIVALRLLLQVWFFAPYLGDGLAYHLPKIAEWVRAGGFTGEMGIDPRSTFPAGFELIEAWWVVFLHHDVLIEMAGVEFLLLTATAVHAIADGMGWGRRTAMIAAGLVVLNPTIHFQATSALNDGAVAGLVLTCTALIVSGAHPMVVLLPAAMGAGVKPTFIYALPGLLLLAALFPRGDGVGLRRPRTMIALAATALLVGAFWYLRNYAIHGNPIHPMGAEGMKSVVSGARLQRMGPSFQALWENLRSFLDLRVYDAGRAPDAMATANFGWGPAGFALGAVALIPVLRSDTLMRRLSLGLTLSVLSIFTLVELDVWNNRFIVFIAALPALALARLWDRHRFVAAMGLLALLLQFLETFVPGNLPPQEFVGMVRQGWRERASLPPPTEAQSGVVAFTCDDFGGAYPLYRANYGTGIIYVRDQTTDQLLDHLDRDRVTLVYVSHNLPRRSAIFVEAVRRGRLRPVMHGDWRGFEVLPKG